MKTLIAIIAMSLLVACGTSRKSSRFHTLSADKNEKKCFVIKHKEVKHKKYTKVFDYKKEASVKKVPNSN